MDNDELVRLLSALPGGEWRVEPTDYADGRSVVAIENGKTLVVATDMTPEAATFLVAAREALPQLLEAIQEERAYYAGLEAESTRLHSLAHDLTTQLAAREAEVYELCALETAEAAPNMPDVESLPPPGMPRFTLRATQIPAASL